MQKYLAEFLGTLTLVFFGCGSAVLAGAGVGDLGISISFGLTLLMLVYAIGPISGCHVNPAVTIAMLVNGKIGTKDTVGYIIFQCLGAVAGAALIGAIAGQFDSLGQNVVREGFTQNQGLLAEFVLTLLFVSIIFGATSRNAPAGFAGIAIGAALLVVHIVGIPETFTSVNPARSFGPALLAGGEALNQLWIFVVAPVAGGIVAAIIARVIGTDK